MLACIWTLPVLNTAIMNLVMEARPDTRWEGRSPPPAARARDASGGRQRWVMAGATASAVGDQSSDTHQQASDTLMGWVT